MAKFIRLTFDPPVIPENSNIRHIETSYQISKFPMFDNSDSLVYENLNDSVNLTRLRTEVEVDEDTVLYVRTRFHFYNDITNTRIDNQKWSRVIPVSGGQKRFKFSDGLVNTPVVDAFLDVDAFVVKTSSFSMFAGSGNHLSTSWLITDSDGKVIFKREEDEDNLIEIKLDKDMIDSDKGYVVQVKHHSDTEQSSNYGRKIFVTYNTLFSLFDLVPFGEFRLNKKQYFRVKIYTPMYDNIDIEIRNKNNLVVKYVYNTRETTPSILLDNMEIYETYHIYARITLQDGTVTRYKWIDSFILQEAEGLGYNPYKTYLNTYSRSNDLLTNGGSCVVSAELNDSEFLFTGNDTKTVNFYKLAGTQVSKVKEAFKISEQLGVNYMNIIPLYSGNILLNYSCEEGWQGSKIVDEFKNSEIVTHNNITLSQANLTAGNFTKIHLKNDTALTIRPTLKPYRRSVFGLYEYNPIKKVIEFVNEVVRPNELYSTAMNSSAAVLSNNEVYYVPAREVNASGADINLSLYKINTITLEITKVANLPFAARRNVSLVADHLDNIYVFGGSVNTMVNEVKEDYWSRDNNKIYLFKNGVFTDYADFPATYSRSIYSIHAKFRVDGRIVFFNSVHNYNELGNLNTLVLNLSNKTFTAHSHNTYIGTPFRNTVWFKSGDMLRISSKQDDPQYSLLYPSDTISSSSVVTPPNYITISRDLVVRAGETVSIECPYFFTNIEIEDGGLLRWVDNELVREFRHKDLLVTRSKVMTKEQYDSRGYNTVTILDGVSFRID